MKKKYFKNYTRSLFIILALCFLNSEQSHAQFTLASDNANEAAYSSSFETSQNGGYGYTAWAITNGTNTGTYTGDPMNDGMSNADIGNNAFAFYATGSDYLNAIRGFNALELNDALTFYWAMNYDANTGSKGFDFKNGGTTIFSVNNGSTTDITTTNGTATTTYGTNAMLVTVKRLLANDYEFSMTSKSGGTTYSTTFNSAATIDGINIYIGNQNDGAGQRNTYFNNFEIKNDANFNITTGTETYTKDFSGTDSLVKSGAGILVLSGNHTYSGITDVDAGILKLQGNLTNSDVTVKSGATLEIDGNITVKSITVEAGGYVKVNSGVNLTVTDDLTLNSSSTSYSSLISDGAITGIVDYNRHINGAAGTGSTTGSNDLVSSPLSGMTFGDLRLANSNILSGTIGGGATLYLFGSFDNSSVNDYVLFEETTDDGIMLTPGIGYRTGSTDGGTYTFTGTVETNAVNQPITTPSGGSKYNLIGNPYPSYIKLKEFLLANNGEFDTSSAGLYGYDGATADGWVTLNLAYAFDPVNMGAVITPGQGFFVASKSGGGTVAFDPSLRTTGDSDDYVAGRNPNVVTNLELSLSNTTATFVTDIYFTDFSTQGLDPGYDTSLFGSSAPAFSLYSHLVTDNTGIPMAIQSLGETDYGNVIIPLGVKASLGEQITFNITANTLPATAEIYLDDNVANTSTLLTSGDYTMTPSVNLNGTGRFYLRFTDTTLSTIENNLDDLSIKTNQSNKTIVINGQLFETTVAKIYDLQGRVINTSILQTANRLHTIDVSDLSSGVYVVQLTNATQNKTQKVIIH